MTSKEIVDAVTSYVRDENAKYAILIDGAKPFCMKTIYVMQYQI